MSMESFARPRPFWARMEIGRSRDERGAAAVEFALVLPILILLVFGIIEFGFVFNRWLTVTHAAREGVRVYSLTGDVVQAQTAGQDAAPDLAGSVTCTGTMPTPSQVSMTCSTVYDVSLVVIEAPVTVRSHATMRRE